MLDKLQYLSQINLFDELSMKDLMAIDKISHMKPLKKGTLILSPLQRIPALFLLKKGTVRLYRSNEQGKEITVDLLGKGNIFGETSSFSLNDDQIYAEAMSDIYLCLISKDEFEDLLEKKPKLAVKFIGILSAKLKDTYDMTEQIALNDVRHRMLALFLKLSEKFGKRQKDWQTIGVRVTHNDIATMIGSTRETVSAMMSELKKKGLIGKTPFSLRINVPEIQKDLKQ
jgi:cAMP-binding proteins - catabolite gene activator and regulatory subunit of cAMP-dependent protein kinases